MGSGVGHAAQATRPAQRTSGGNGRSQGSAAARAMFGKPVFLRPCRCKRTRITGAIKSIGRLVPSAQRVTALAPPPIDVVVFHGPQGRSRFKGGFPLRMPSAVIPSVHSYAALPLARQQLHQRYVHPGPLVLGTKPLKPPTPTADRDRTVSRRSEPSSRTTLIGEQPNPWDLLQPQDVMTDIEVPNDPVDMDSWGHQPVIPGVPFIR